MAKSKKNNFARNCKLSIVFTQSLNPRKKAVEGNSDSIVQGKVQGAIKIQEITSLLPAFLFYSINLLQPTGAQKDHVCKRRKRCLSIQRRNKCLSALSLSPWIRAQNAHRCDKRWGNSKANKVHFCNCHRQKKTPLNTAAECMGGRAKLVWSPAPRPRGAPGVKACPALAEEAVPGGVGQGVARGLGSPLSGGKCSGGKISC